MLSPPPFARFVALTDQVFTPLLAEVKTCKKAASALLPPGTVVVYPPPITLRPVGQVAVAVPLVSFVSVNGVPLTYCKPEMPGAP